MPALRIVGGRLSGQIVRAPGNLPVRPTTDRAKESLFNILHNRYDLESIRVLDLFSGTGNMSYEFISRGCNDVTAVDKHPACVRFIKENARKPEFAGLQVIASDAFSFLKKAESPWHIIFGDAPYDMEKITEIPGIVASQHLLYPGGVLILEHESRFSLQNISGFSEIRVYGQSSFSFFTFETVS